MPSKKQEFSYPGQTTEQLLLIAYGTFLELGWTPKYAGPNAIVGYTPRSWSKYDDEITVQATNGSINVTSSLIHNESFDMLGKNKKHINDFITAFEKVKATGILPEWEGELEKLRQQTSETAAQYEKQAEEVDAVMNLSRSNLYLTYAIIAINVIVFILMAIDGAGIFEANGFSQVKWGSNYTPLTLSGDWWRLITCVFIHFGIFHLAMNTYAFYMAGVYLEPMLGKAKFILAYLCTGVFASLASIWWHSDGVNSAGASGAIFGMYGVFLALLLTNLIPKQIRRSLLTSIGVFVVFNLVYGTKAGVDNAAHIGGLLSGLVIGFAFYPLLIKNDKGIKSTIAMLAIAGITFLVAKTYISNPGKKINQETRQAEINYIREMDFPDGKAYYEKYDQFAEADQNIMSLLYNGAYTYAGRISKNEAKMNEEINKGYLIIDAMKKYQVSERAKKKIDLLEQLLNARKEDFESIRKLATEDNAANQLLHSEIREKGEKLVEELKSIN
jgi:rhomboid protease GluP